MRIGCMLIAKGSRGLCAAAVAGILSTAPAVAQDAVTLQLKWVVQAQVAGYLVPDELGLLRRPKASR